MLNKYLIALCIYSLSLSLSARPLLNIEEQDEIYYESCQSGVESAYQSVKPVADKKSIQINELNVLSDNKLLALEEGIVLKNGKAILRVGRGGSLKLFHGYIPVWRSLGRHIELADNPEDSTKVHFRFTDLEQRLMDESASASFENPILSDDENLAATDEGDKIGENASSSGSFKNLVLSDDGNLTATDEDDKIIWQSNTFMAQADDVLTERLTGEKAPNSVVHSKTRNLDWRANTDPTVLLKNGDSRLEWSNKRITFYQHEQPIFHPTATGGPVWQANGTLAIYDGAPYFVWGSYNWMHNVQVGTVLGISDQNELMITDDLGCVTWEASGDKGRTWSTLKSRRQMCKRILSDKWLYKKWMRSRASFDSLKCSK